MLKNRCLLLGATFMLFLSCSDETIVYQDTLRTDDISIENDEAVLQQSISFSSAGAFDIFKDISTNRSAQKSFDDEQAGDYPLTQIAQIKPPVFRGSLLTSTHVHVADEYAFVSYNAVGETYLGAVDIIRISNPKNPRLTSRLYYTNADINSLQYDNGYIYIAGGVNAELSNLATDNSFVGKIRVVNGKFDITSGITYGFQAGNNATDIVIDNDKVLVASGLNGLLTTYDKTSLTLISELPFNDLRSLAKNGSQLAVLDATTGVSILDQNNQTILQFPINTDLGAVSKKALDFGDNMIIVPEASRGAGIYDSNTGRLLEHIDIPTNPILENPGDKTTNAVGLNENLILMANGGAGLCLSELLPDGSLGVVGIMELEGSINFLATKGDYIIAASGTQGVQIIKFNRPSASLVDRCKDLPEYRGSSKLIVLTNDNRAYSGSKNFNNINVSGALLLCGSWTVRNSVNIRERGLFEMKGMMTVGRNNRRRNVVVEENAIIRIEGDLTIYGDLILEEGATLEFLGDDNKVNIFGDVEMAYDVTVTGTFEDIRGKF
ncbi:MAG: hypothetical protein HKN89_10570 [Eudoraea sp.]|nr:hypothetical protein [Eudoraea sp.]